MNDYKDAEISCWVDKLSSKHAIMLAVLLYWLMFAFIFGAARLTD